MTGKPLRPETTRARYRVLIADDHELLREGLSLLLERDGHFEVVAKVGDGTAAVAATLALAPDLVLLDAAMPGKDGLETLREVRRAAPDTKVLVVSMFAEDQYGVRFLREGADGYLTKDSAPATLLEAIAKIRQGGKYLSPRLAESLVQHLEDGPGRDSPERLSDRELQVLRSLASGRTVSEIAVDLGLSVKTISTYRRRVLYKLRLKNTAQIMHYAINRGLVTL